MTAPRVLRVSHSAVVGEWRERERLLHAQHGYDMELVCAPKWPEGTALVTAAPTEPALPVHLVPVHGRTHHPILFWYDIPKLTRLIRRMKPELIDVCEEPYSLAAASVRIAASLARCHAPMCVFTAQNITKRYPLPFRSSERAMYRRVRAVYPCSVEADRVLRWKGFEGRTLVIPLGVPQFADRSRAIPTGKVGFVGRLTPEKGPQLLLEAIARLRQESHVTLEIVGGGPQEPELRRAAQDLRIADSITFTGSLPPDEARRRIAAFDVLVVPSISTATWREQFCRVAVEGLAIGTPVLASRSGSLPSVLGPAAEYFSEGDVSDLAAKLRHMLSDTPFREALALEGRRRVDQQFAWERVAERFDELYRIALSP